MKYYIYTTKLSKMIPVFCVFRIIYIRE